MSIQIYLVHLHYRTKSLTNNYSMLENYDGRQSFAENGLKQRTIYNNGIVFDRPMFVKEALEACRANFEVRLRPIAFITPDIESLIANNENVPSELLKNCFCKSNMATVRTDKNICLGITSPSYGIVQNSKAFEFVDTLCSGLETNRTEKPVIETCGVIGNGERIFVTCRMPQDIVLNSRRDDVINSYIVFTTSHDGTGSVKCMVTNVRVACENTLNFAMKHNTGRVSFRHSKNVLNRLELNEENAKFAYKSLNLYNEYQEYFKGAIEHLRNLKLAERDLDRILAEITLSDESRKVFFETNNINHEDIKTKGRNIFIGMKDSIENGIGQNLLESGSALWAINGITSYYQNNAKYKNDDIKFTNITEGSVYNKVQHAYNRMIEVAA